jgi:Flp pilus assembly pilin Flp
MRGTSRSARNRSGQALVENALVIALVAVGLTFALLGLRNSVGNAYTSASDSVDQATACAYGGSGTGCTTTNPGGSGGDQVNGDNGNGNGNNGNGNGNNGNGNGNGANGNGNGGNGNGNGGNGSGNGNGNGGGKKG